MIFDLHLHYPMHLRPRRPEWAALRDGSRRAAFGDWFDSRLLAALGRVSNYPSFTSGPAATVAAMRQGGVTAACSVLTHPLLEMGERLTIRYQRKPPYGGAPRDHYFEALVRQLELVEHQVEQREGAGVSVVRSPDELERAVAAGDLALLHCVEGGFHLGATPEVVEANVARLARLGVVYITLAHLAWRRVATNAAAAPWVSDAVYDRAFPQPSLGLSELGRAAVRAMVEHRIIIDVTHMSQASLDDTFGLLDELDPQGTVPVIASHVGFRFGRRGYNLSTETVARIGERGGVIGLICSDHYISDGLGSRSRTLEQSLDRLTRHAEAIHAITGSHAHTAIGSDHDGFIKPALAGLETPARFARLEQELRARLGAAAADICAGNALRLLRTYWQGAATSRV